MTAQSLLDTNVVAYTASNDPANAGKTAIARKLFRASCFYPSAILTLG